MNEYVLAIIYLLSGLGILMVGFKLLSDNLEKLANTGLKKMFSKKNKNHLGEVGIGAAATAIMHSSAATTVMVVGFVNAGIMNLYQATAMIMGANIGTTITAQIVALGEFDFSVYAMLLAIIGVVIYMVAKKDKVKALGNALSGLGLVFIALDMMSSSMTVFSELDEFKQFLSICDNPLLLLLFGIVFTALLQSSTAVTTIIISMVSVGLSIGSNGNSILYVILGSNIGTCVTALLSSIGASANAKRASFIHFLFNFAGGMIFFIMLLLWPSFMDVTFGTWFKDSPSTQVAMFHTFFNVICTIIFLPLIGLFVKASTFIIKGEKVETRTSYLDERFLKSPVIAMNQAIKETIYMGELSVKVLSKSIESFVNKDVDLIPNIRNDIREIDHVNQSIISYVIKISSTGSSNESEKAVTKIHSIINDFYREVEIADNMIKYTETTIRDGLSFSDHAYEKINEFKEKLNKQFYNVLRLVETKDKQVLKDIAELEDSMDKQRSDMINEHIQRLERNECKPANSAVFINLVSNLERAGDHLDYVAQTIVE